MYDELDVEERTESIDGRQIPCCEMNFYYLDLTNTATVRVISSNRAHYIVLWQAEDRDFADLQEVFAAMTVSLVQESEWLQSETDVAPINASTLIDRGSELAWKKVKDPAGVR